MAVWPWNATLDESSKLTEKTADLGIGNLHENVRIRQKGKESV